MRSRSWASSGPSSTSRRRAASLGRDHGLSSAAEPAVRSIKGFAPWLALGTAVQDRSPPPGDEAGHRVWHRAVPYLLSAGCVAAALAIRLILQRLGVVGASEMRMT